MPVSEEDSASLAEALRYGWDKTSVDLGAVLRASGYNVSEEWAIAYAKKKGFADGDPLTLERACEAAAEVEQADQATDVFAKAFKPMDKYGDGTITNTDLRLVLGNMGDLKQDEIEEMIDEVDPKGVGRVYISDVLAMFGSKIS